MASREKEVTVRAMTREPSETLVDDILTNDEPAEETDSAKILVVDDEQQILWLIGRFLRRLDYEVVEASSGDATEFIIAETMHHDFTSLPLLTPLAGNIGLRGTIPGERVLDLINDYTLAFFNQYLLGMDQGLLLPENAPYSEAQFVSRP